MLFDYNFYLLPLGYLPIVFILYQNIHALTFFVLFFIQMISEAKAFR